MRLALAIVGLLLATAGTAQGACAVSVERSSRDFATRTESMATLIDTIVPALEPWVASVRARCGAPAADGLPARAERALRAARAYPARMWGRMSSSFGRLRPAAVLRARVDGAPAWIFALVGPREVDWRYAVVRDGGRVIAWQLTGTDAQRLFGTTSQGGTHD